MNFFCLSLSSPRNLTRMQAPRLNPMPTNCVAGKRWHKSSKTAPMSPVPPIVVVVCAGVCVYIRVSVSVHGTCVCMCVCASNNVGDGVCGLVQCRWGEGVDTTHREYYSQNDQWLLYSLAVA